MESEIQKRYLTIKEAAEFLNMSIHTLRSRVAPGSSIPLKINGRIFKPARVNGRIRFDRIALEKAMGID